MTKLTIHEQLMLARKIKDDLGVLADYLWMEHDAHINSSLERLEVQLGTLIRSFYVDYFPNVEWVQKLATTEPERDPIN